MREADYRRVVDEMRLADYGVFPIPITLPVSDVGQIALDREVALRRPLNDLLAVMRVEEVQKAMQHFTAERMLRETAVLYADVLAPRTPAEA